MQLSKELMVLHHILVLQSPHLEVAEVQEIILLHEIQEDLEVVENKVMVEEQHQDLYSQVL